MATLLDNPRALRDTLVGFCLAIGLFSAFWLGVAMLIFVEGMLFAPQAEADGGIFWEAWLFRLNVLLAFGGTPIAAGWGGVWLLNRWGQRHPASAPPAAHDLRRGVLWAMACCGLTFSPLLLAGWLFGLVLLAVGVGGVWLTGRLLPHWTGEAPPEEYDDEEGDEDAGAE